MPVRELKFRDYDLETKQIRHFDLDSYNKYEHDSYGNVTEFTGMKDYNGIDIYEGDILSKVVISELGKTIDFFYVVKWSSSDCGYRVYRYRLDENENGLYWRKQPSSDSLHMAQCYAHVVGNIFENKDLLEQ